MSVTAIIPPPSSASLRRRVPRLTRQARALLTAMNLHFAAVAALVVLDLYLIVHLLLVWQALGTHNAAAIDQQRVQMKSAQIAAMPLRGLDGKLADSTKAANTFYQQRLPYAYSEVLAELGSLTKKEGVRLTRVQYAQEPVLMGSDALIEVRMDASVSGDYRPIVQFVNATERDKMFFLISGMNLTGQQTGQVNLRLRMTTYLRAPGPDEMTGDLPVPDAVQSAAPTAGGSQ